MPLSKQLCAPTWLGFKKPKREESLYVVSDTGLLSLKLGAEISEP